MNEIMRALATLRRALWPLLLAAALSGCLDSGEDTSESSTPPVADNPAPADPLPSNPVDPIDLSPVKQNRPPEIAGTPPLSIEVGELYTFVPKASDADNDFLEFTITNRPEWATFSEETGELTGIPTDKHVGETDDITISVSDGRDTRSIGPFRIRIIPRSQVPAPTNAPPTIEGTPAGSVMVDQSYSFRPSASDPDNDSLRFSIANRPSWATFSSTTGALTGTPRTRHIGTYSNIVITVTDGTETASLGPFTIQVLGPNNRAPTISGTPATSVQATRGYSFTPSASDPDGDNLTFSIVNKPSWASFSTTTGRLSGTPAATDVGNYANIVISVSDGRASASLPAFSINVQAAPNNAPTISGTPPTSVTAGSSYSFTPTASDKDNDSLGFSIVNAPKWAQFDTATGRLSGTPSASDVGTYSNIVITVSDGRASASLPAFSIRVDAPTVTNRPPTISGTPPTSVEVGTAYSFRPSASDPDGDSLTFSVSNAPSWLTLDSRTGRLSGTPTAAHVGRYQNIVISVTDGRSTVSLPAFTITVAQPAATGTATLSWQPPTQNVDGSALTDLAGFRIAYGKSSGSLDQLVELPNPGLTTYVVTNLGSGTWYFAVRAYNTKGVESDLSNIASKTIP
jgi:hypothetical protein